MNEQKKEKQNTRKKLHAAVTAFSAFSELVGSSAIGLTGLGVGAAMLSQSAHAIDPALTNICPASPGTPGTITYSSTNTGMFACELYSNEQLLVTSSGTIINTGIVKWDGAIRLASGAATTNSGITNNGLIAIGNAYQASRWQGAIMISSKSTFTGNILNTGTLWGGAGTFGSTTLTGGTAFSATSTKISSGLPDVRHTGLATWGVLQIGDIENTSSGLIYGTSAAIGMGVNNMQGNILNAGRLIARWYDGVSAYSGTNLNGNITNTGTGTIIAGEYGIGLGNATTATSSKSNFSGFSGTIVNNGLITSTNLINTVDKIIVGNGIMVGRIGILGGVVNTGTIGGDAMIGIGVYNEQQLGFVAGTAAHTINPTTAASASAHLSGRIINSGLISSSATSTIGGQAIGAGIMIGTRGYVTQGIENNSGGSIIGAGQGGAAGIVLTPRYTTTSRQLPVLTTNVASKAAISNNGGSISGIINSGTISGKGGVLVNGTMGGGVSSWTEGSLDGVAIQIAAGEVGTIINGLTTGAGSGSTTVAGGGMIKALTTAIDLSGGGTVTGGILNRGVISGNIKLGTVSNNVLRLNSGSTIISTATLTNTTRYNLGNGTVGLNAAGSTISGSFDNGSVSYGSMYDVTNTSLGVLEVDVVSNALAGKVNITGAATFAAGAGIYIDTQSGVSLAIGQSFTILTATGGITQSGFVVGDNSTDFDFVAGASGNNIVVSVVSQASTPAVTNTATNTPTTAITDTATNTPTTAATDTATQSPTATTTATGTATQTPTATTTATQTPTATVTPINSNTATQTPTATTTATQSPTSATSTATSTATQTPTATVTPINSNTATQTPTATTTATQSPTSASTSTVTNTATQTPTATVTPINSNTATQTPTATNTATRTPTAVSTNTATPTATNTNTPTPTNNTGAGYWESKADKHTRSLGRALDVMEENGDVDEELGGVLDVISGLPDDKIPGALAALLPGLAAAGIDIMPAIMRALSGGMNDEGDQHGSSSGDPSANDKFVWMKPFAVNVTQDQDGGVPGYDANIGGVVVGADDKISANIRAGWSAGYAQTNMDGEDAYNGQSLDMDTYQLGLYARKEDGDVFTTGRVRFGWSNNDSERAIPGSGTVKADYDSWYAVLNASIGKTYSSGGVTLSPELSVAYAYIDQEGYTEHGPGAPLKVDSQNKDSLIFSIGGKATMGLLTAHLEVGVETLDDQTEITSAFASGGPLFRTEGSNQGDVIVTTGLGLNLMQDQPLNVSINYDAALRDQYDDQEVSATLRYKW